jgi:DNA-directed RNA polymerase subunit M/transcription elongation factor TFIIS
MKSCKKCGEIFTPFSTLDKHCYICKKTEQALKNLAKMKKDKLKKQKEELLTTSDYLKLAQQVFNKWVRLRDQEQGCISCGNPLGSKYDAGHFWSAGGHSSVRFDPDNVHAQCVYCNQYLHGNLLNYQIGIQQRIGADRLIELQAKAHETRKFTRDELKEIISTYKQKINERKDAI